MFILSEVGKESKLYEYDLYLYTQFLVHNNQYYLCIYFHFLTVDYTIRICIFSLIFFVYVQGRSILCPITAWMVKIYIHCYVLCVFTFTKRNMITNYTYILLQKLHRSDQGCFQYWDLFWVVWHVETLLEIQLRKIHINDHTWLDMGDVMNLFPFNWNMQYLLVQVIQPF